MLIPQLFTLWMQTNCWLAGFSSSVAAVGYGGVMYAAGQIFYKEIHFDVCSTDAVFTRDRFT